MPWTSTGIIPMIHNSTRIIPMIHNRHTSVTLNWTATMVIAVRVWQLEKCKHRFRHLTCLFHWILTLWVDQFHNFYSKTTLPDCPDEVALNQHALTWMTAMVWMTFWWSLTASNLWDKLWQSIDICNALWPNKTNHNLKKSAICFVVLTFEGCTCWWQLAWEFLLQCEHHQLWATTLASNPTRKCLQRRKKIWPQHNDLSLSGTTFFES